MWDKLITLCQPILSLPAGDKICHAIFGFIITLVVGLFFASVAYGLIAGFLAGLIKEAIDEYGFRKGTRTQGANFFDFFATILGAFFGGALVVILL